MRGTSLAILLFLFTFPEIPPDPSSSRIAVIIEKGASENEVRVVVLHPTFLGTVLERSDL